MAPHLIVAVDDEPTLLEVYADLLQDEGYDTICCYSGKEAYEIIFREMPVFVILDMQMEQVDAGMVALQMMRLNPDMKDIPVLICSADGAFLRSKQEQLQLHRCQVLEKPFDILEVLTIIERMLAA